MHPPDLVFYSQAQLVLFYLEWQHPSGAPSNALFLAFWL